MYSSISDDVVQPRISTIMEHLVDLLQNNFEDESFFVIFSLLHKRYRNFSGREFRKLFDKIMRLCDAHEVNSSKYFVRQLCQLYLLCLFSGEEIPSNT